MTEISFQETFEFGIKKIIDHKHENGVMYYKVEWEPTWEPAEGLTSCQRLVDQFWTSVKNQKETPSLPQEPALKRKILLDTRVSDILSDYRLSESSRLDIQRILDNTMPSHTVSLNATLKVEQPLKVEHLTRPLSADSPVLSTGLKRSSTSAPAESTSQGTLSTSGVQYIENFSNPYVKLVVVCKSCSKEQHPKRPGDWKRHYLSHVSDEEKPHKCDVCGKAFVANWMMKKHRKTHEKRLAIKQEIVKQEIM